MKEVEKFLSLNHYYNVKYNEPLSKHTTFRVGGIAKIIVTPGSKDKLIQLIIYLARNHIPYKVLGKGSNILPSDKNYDGVIIKTNKSLNYIQVNKNEVIVGAGYSLVKLAHDMIKYELSGSEFLGGIPGTIGGAIYMNAGAYNKEMKDVVQSVTCLSPDGKLIVYKKDELKFSYRHSIFQQTPTLLILETHLKLEKGNREEIKDLLKRRQEKRMKTQPLEYPSGGSTFRNPEGTHAYLLIDQAGLRGYSIGGAKVSEKHCNFIINHHHAKSQDIKDLVDYIKKQVYHKTGKTLQSEIEFFNW